MEGKAVSFSKLVMLAAMMLFACILMGGMLVGCGGSASDIGSTSSGSASEKAASSESASEEAVSSVSSESAASEELNETESTEPQESEDASEAAAADSREQLKEALDEKIDGSILFDSSVRNDKTGNWRLARVATSSPITDYAKDYYDAYFTDDGEVHALINFTTKETNNITAGLGLLYIDTHQYVDGEEHDAAELFSGPVIAQYIVDLSTGEVETL